MILDRDMLMRTMAFCCPGLIAQHIARSLAEIGPWCPDRSLFLARPPGHAAENLLYDIFRIFMPRPSREDVLRPIWEKRGQPTTGHVFLNRFGNPYSDTRKAKIPGGNPIKNQHATACKRAGIEDFTVHDWRHHRSEEHTSELQSLMRISYAVFCLKKKNNKNTITN